MTRSVNSKVRDVGAATDVSCAVPICKSNLGAQGCSELAIVSEPETLLETTQGEINECMIQVPLWSLEGNQSGVAAGKET